MLERQTQIDLLWYEIDHLRYFNKQEEQLSNIFGPMEWVPGVPCQDYKLLYLILDDMGVAPDSKIPRDCYNDLYFNLYYKEDLDSADIDIFLDEILKLKAKNENKKRIRK